MFPKPNTYYNDEYKDFVKTLNCCACNRVPWGDYKSIPHHTSSNGTGKKCTDLEVIPLCHDHHTEYHSTAGGKETFYRNHGLDMWEEIGKTQVRFIEWKMGR